MSTLKPLIDYAWLTTGHMSKKAYTTGMIVFLGAIAVSAILIGINGFTGFNNATQVPTYEIEEKTQMMEDMAAEEALQDLYIELTKAHYKSVEKNSVASVTLRKEEDTEKNLKASANISGTEAQTLSAEDYTAMIRIVEAEATDEDLIGKILIANVVMNRVEVEGFPNNIYDVVHQKYNGRAQFSPIDDGRYYSVSITNSTEEAVAAALSGADYSEGALFFVAKSLASKSAGSWFDRDLSFIMKHGVHSFYKY